MAYETLLADVADKVLTITINRPERLNALSKQVWAELEQALRAADADDGIGAVVLTGSGRAFSSGADMSHNTGPNPDPPRGVAEWYAEEQYAERKHRLFRDMSKPIVAA